MMRTSIAYHVANSCPVWSAGHVDVTAELAQELLEAADQYMLDNLKRLCEIKNAEELQPDNVSVVSAS